VRQPDVVEDKAGVNVTHPTDEVSFEKFEAESLLAVVIRGAIVSYFYV
jgi:hypothetical protein